MTPPKPHVAQGYCQPSWLRKQDRDDPLLPWQHSLLPQAAFCPFRSVPSSHNPCFFCWPAERSLPSWKRAQRPGPPQLMQYLLLQSRAGAAENGLLCAGQLWEGGGSRGPLLLRASGVKPKLPRHSGAQTGAGHGLWDVHMRVAVCPKASPQGSRAIWGHGDSLVVWGS